MQTQIDYYWEIRYHRIKEIGGYDPKEEFVNFVVANSLENAVAKINDYVTRLREKEQIKSIYITYANRINYIIY